MVFKAWFCEGGNPGRKLLPKAQAFDSVDLATGHHAIRSSSFGGIHGTTTGR
jgi:hypothetical protein